MQDLVEKLTEQLQKREWLLATAESCTGGLLSTAITHRPGSSNVFDRGFITYSNEAKIELLSVPEQLLTMNGAVSAQCAEAMARGALKHSNAHLSVSITGIAGPEGGSDEKPVGLVFFGFALKGGSAGSIEVQFEGTREQIRGQAAVTALKQLLTVLESEPS